MTFSDLLSLYPWWSVALLLTVEILSTLLLSLLGEVPSNDFLVFSWLTNSYILIPEQVKL